jgi:hypothetical protein
LYYTIFISCEKLAQAIGMGPEALDSNINSIINTTPGKYLTLALE